VSERTDTELVAGVLAGDRDAFAAVYDRYSDRLHDFCWSVLRDRDEAADAVQDTFVLAAQRLVQLNDPERLRPWLYAVARSVALRRVRARQRVVLDEVGDMADTDPGPHRAAEQEALRELVWTAAGGLSERDRALLDLHVRQGLEGAELGQAMGVSTSHAYVLLTRLRDQVERSLGALLIARLGREDCTELDALLSNWDGRFSPILRKRVARHVDQCDVCSERRRIVVSPWALLAAVPLLPAPLWLRDRVMNQVQLASMDTDLPTEQHPGGGPSGGASGGAAAGVAAMDEQEVVAPLAAAGGSRFSKRTRALAAAAAVLALLIAVSAVVYWRNSDEVDGKPLALDNSVPLTTTRTTTTGTSTTTPLAAPPAAPPTTTTRPTTTRTTTRRTTTTTNAAQPPPPPPPVITTTTPPPDNPPEITNASAAPSEFYRLACESSPNQSFVSVSVSDDVGVGSVRLHWNGPTQTSGDPEPSGGGGNWTFAIGPVSSRTGGTLTWTVTATDTAGQTNTRTGTLTVLDCQIG
jgi:RNA polymerase sigma factor (sigma-70 family)